MDSTPQPPPDPFRSLTGFHDHVQHHLAPLLALPSHPALTPVQSQILWDVVQWGEVTAAELSAQRGLDPGYLSRSLRTLEKAGLVLRQPSKQDGRTRPISATPEGHALVNRWDRERINRVKEHLAPLHPHEAADLASALETAQALLASPSGHRAREESPQRRRIRLRPPRPGDLGWIVARHGVLYHREKGWGARFEGLVAGVVDELIQGFDPALDALWIAEQDQQRVGSVAVMGDRNRPGVARLRLLLVEPRARGQGIGTRLVQSCTRFARRAGFRKLRLWTDSGLDAARRLYEAEGYRLVEEEPHDYFGDGLVGQFWELKLDAPPATPKPDPRS